MYETCLFASGSTRMEGVVTPPQTAQKVVLVAYVWWPGSYRETHVAAPIRDPCNSQRLASPFALEPCLATRTRVPAWQGHPKQVGGGAGELPAPWEQPLTKDR